MADFRVERRAAVNYIGLPVEASMEALPAVVGPAFSELAAYLDMRGAETIGAGLIRYRQVLADGHVSLEVASAVSNTPRVRDRYVIDQLTDGLYAVAEQRGPFSWIAGLTNELMTWVSARGLDPARTPEGDWECWYECYPETPAEGRNGLEGIVHVCILLSP